VIIIIELFGFCFSIKRNIVFDISGVNFAILRLCLPFTVHSLS